MVFIEESKRKKTRKGREEERKGKEKKERKGKGKKKRSEGKKETKKKERNKKQNSMSEKKEWSIVVVCRNWIYVTFCLILMSRKKKKIHELSQRK